MQTQHMCNVDIDIRFEFKRGNLKQQLSKTQALPHGAKTAENLIDSLGCQWVFNRDGLTIE